MVVLDEDRVVETGSVIRAPAGSDRLLLERAQSRRRLPRVEDHGARSVDGLDVASRQGRDARQAAEEVERETFRRENASRRPLHAGDRARRYAVSVGNERLQRRAELGEDGRGDIEAEDDAGLLGADLGDARGIRLDQGLGRHVTRADVLGEPRARVEGRQCHVSNAIVSSGRTML